MDLCECGHEQDRHTGESGTGPCLRCNCSVFILEARVDTSSEVTEKEVEKVKKKLSSGHTAW